MKCPDLHRKVIFAIPNPHEGINKGTGGTFQVKCIARN